MALLTGFNVTLPEVELMVQASLAAFTDGSVPAGWSVVSPQNLVPARYWDGNYFSNDGASAIVLKQGNSWIISFRGTDSSADVAKYPELVAQTYLDNFKPLLVAVATNAAPSDQIYVTGASLGGAATNELADKAFTDYAGRYASAKFVAFASPEISNNAGILNVGFENDPIYKVIEQYRDQPSSMDNLVLAKDQYLQGNYNGQNPLDYYAHTAGQSADAIARLESSHFLNQMSPDATIVFDASAQTVTDVTPGREAATVFYIGQNGDDVIAGRNGTDYIDGLGGNDTIVGGAGADWLAGGAGNDQVQGGAGRDTAVFSAFRTQATVSGSATEHTVVTPTEGTDALSSIEAIQFQDGRLAYDVTDPAAVVLRAYDAAFNRAPDPTGLAYWTAQLDAGASVSSVAAAFAGSAEFQAKYGALDNQQFVSAIYQNVLDRAGDPTGVSYWTQQLDSGAATRGQVLAGFSESPEHVEQSRAQIEAGYWEQDPVVASVARLYDAAFNHRPDPTGLTFWDNAAMGQSLNAVAAGFVASSEFSATYGSLSNQQFVQQIYQNVVDRPGDSAGVSYWTSALDHGTSRADVLLGFSESPEHRALTSSWIDQGILFA
ncbi:DUF4214 domain-containing protein [Alsobacter sp. KACC 23698]|uniref:DUF4214 domain-containing protein n=1 Tax=Alsobacter sp. KACC 23698 TaxID=3149229 RepID=A0AAU7JM92_9HYPH